MASEVSIAAYHTSTINTNEAYFIDLELTADASSRLATYNLGGIGSSTPQLVLVNGNKQISMSTQSPISSAFVGPCEFITGGTIVVLDDYLPVLLEVLDTQLP